MAAFVARRSFQSAAAQLPISATQPAASAGIRPGESGPSSASSSACVGK